MKFSITDFFSKCDQIRRKLRIWSHLLKKSVVENFIFFVQCFFVGSFVAVYIHRTCNIVSDYFLGTSLIISIMLEIVYQGFERPLTVCFIIKTNIRETDFLLLTRQEVELFDPILSMIYY